MNEILDKKHYRRTFYVVFSLLVFVLILVRYSVIPMIEPSTQTSFVSALAGITDKILTSLIVTVAIGSFVFWLRPEIMQSAQMEVIEPRAISDLLQRSMRKTDIWWFKGGCGRYFRAETLPQIAKSARASNGMREINVLILDPSNEHLCEGYATYRRSLKSAKDDKPWIRERVENELYATILSVAIKRYEEPLLRINLGLLKTFSSFRLDLSSDYIIITKEEKTAPAVRCDRDTFFYKSYQDEMALSLRHSRQIPELESAPIDEFSPDDVQSILNELGFDTEKLDAKRAADILYLVKSAENPYA